MSYSIRSTNGGLLEASPATIASSGVRKSHTNLEASAFEVNSVRVLFAVEQSLKNLHFGQGLGFQVAGVVVDRKTLTNVAMALFGGLTTLISVLLALSEAPATNVTARMDTCDVGASDEVLLNIISDAARKLNTLCFGNLTLSELAERP